MQPTPDPPLFDARVSALPGPVRWYLSNERKLLATVSFVGFFVPWEIGAQVGRVNLLFFSSPSRILSDGLVEVQRARFWNDARLSLTELIVGYVAAVLGVVVGLLAGWYRRLNFFLDPWLSFLYALCTRRTRASAS